MEVIRSKRDPRLSATVISRTQLLYHDGPSVELDRPGHVRAGSSLDWFGSRLAVVQDDANFIALFDPRTRQAEGIPLSMGSGGLRQFDDFRGNKGDKLDLEACVAVTWRGESVLVVFGSGSSPAREQIALLRGTEALECSVQPAPELYSLLRGHPEFAGSELNLEGALFIDGVLRLFNRGNGARRDGLAAVNATCDLLWSEAAAYLAAPTVHAPPSVCNVTQYELGSLGGLCLGFTDAAITPLGSLFSAAAEESPDATTDGRVSGAALGTLEPGTSRWIELRERSGELFTDKVEGLCATRDAANRVFVVVDTDDPRCPAELCEVELTGPWLCRATRDALRDRGPRLDAPV